MAGEKHEAANAHKGQERRDWGCCLRQLNLQSSQLIVNRQTVLLPPKRPFASIDVQQTLRPMDRYRVGGGQITPRRSYLDQGGTTPLLRAYAIDCPRCSC